MKEYYFNCNARVETWIDAEDEDEAVDLFAEKIRSIHGLDINVDSYSPEKVRNEGVFCEN